MTRLFVFLLWAFFLASSVVAKESVSQLDPKKDPNMVMDSSNSSAYPTVNMETLAELRTRVNSLLKPLNNGNRLPSGQKVELHKESKGAQ